MIIALTLLLIIALLIACLAAWINYSCACNLAAKYRHVLLENEEVKIELARYKADKEKETVSASKITYTEAPMDIWT